MERKKTIQGRHARWGLLISLLILGVMLVVVASLGYDSARRISYAAAQGQAESLLRELPRERDGSDITSEKLEEILSYHADTGLRYLALLEENGQVLVEAGQRAAGDSIQEGELQGKRRMVKVGDRFRLLTPSPPRRNAQPPRPFRQRNTFGESFQASPGDRQPPPDMFGGAGIPPEHRPLPGDMTAQSPPNPPWIMIEFEPVLSNQMETRAIGTIILSLVVSILFMGAAMVFWRLSVKAEKEMIRSEQDKRLASLGEMSAVMAHEIRNPLGSLKGHAQLLAERFNSGSPERKKSDQVVQEAVRLETLVNDLLDFSRPLKIRLQQTNPGDLMAGAIKSLGEDCFDLLLPSTSQKTWSLDPVQIRQVLINLLRNSLRASPESTKVLARVYFENDRLCFVVRDHGEGITTGDEEKIFEPFYTKSTRGAGLGLAVARRIVELHGGWIRASNHLEGGAEFKVSIPANK